MSPKKHIYESRFDSVYTDVGSAVFELKRRRTSEELEARIRNDVLISPELQQLTQEPHLIIFRQLGTPIFEILRVISIAQKLGIKPFIFEYLNDTFVSSGNTYKRGLGKMPIHKLTSPKGSNVFEYRTIINFNESTGKNINEVKTLTGESLVAFHHDLLTKITGINISELCFDASKWFEANGGTAKEYYRPFLKLFIRDAILFEILIVSDTEEQFASDVIMPAITHIEEEYGLKPLIVRTVEKEDEHNFYWDCYPNAVDEILKEKGYI